MSDAQNLTELPPVARNIYIPCKKCGVERFHKVIAHTSPTSAKVKCEVCGGQSTFKLKKTQTRTTKSSSSSSAAKKAKKAEVDSSALWQQLKEQIGTDHVIPYNMKTKFARENAIEHPKFGLGFVTSATDDKIEVVFQEGGRALVHNRS